MPCKAFVSGSYGFSPSLKWNGITWNRLVAPEREVARGSPQDSICMTVAARFGSTPAALAQRTMSFAQCCTSLVKMGEMPVDVPAGWVGSARSLTGGAASCSTMVELLTGKADGVSGDLNATMATSPTISRAASGG